MSAWSVAVAAIPSLQSWWRLGESSVGSAADSGPAGITGSYGSSGITYGTAGLAAGDANTAVTFDRSVPGSVDCGDNYDFTGTASFTIGLAVKPSIVDGSNSQVISKHDGTGGWYMDYTSGFTRFTRWDSGGGGDGAFYATPPTVGVTYLLVATYDGSTLLLYRDGTQVATNPSTRSLPNTSAVMRIGAFSGGSDGTSGVVDEVFICNAVLSSGTIASLYTAFTTAAEKQSFYASRRRTVATR